MTTEQIHQSANEPPTEEQQIIEEGDLIPISFMNSHKERLHKLLERKKHEMLLEDPTLTEERLNAQEKIVDMYLRLSKEKNKKKPHELPAYLAARIPERKARKRKEATADSMIAQFLECMHRIESEIERGNLWKLDLVWQEVYEGPEYQRRPILTEIRSKRIFKRKIDILLSRHRDRLARGRGQVVLIEEMKQYEVQFLTARQEEDLQDTPEDELIQDIHVYTSKKELQIQRERINSKLRMRLEMGKLNGAAYKLYGYYYDDEIGKRVIIPEEAEVIKLIYTLRAQGNSLKRISVILKERGIKSREGNYFQDTNIGAMLRKTEYKGVTYASKCFYTYEHTGSKKVVHRHKNPNPVLMPEGTTPTIVDEALWQQVQILLSEGKRTSPRRLHNPEEFLLAYGFIFCAECGGPMVIDHRTTNTKEPSPVPNYDVYVCSRTRRIENACKGVCISAKLIDNKVYDFLEKQLAEFGQLQTLLLALREEKQMTIDVGVLQQKAEKIQRQIDKLSDEVVTEEDPDIKQALRRRVATLREEKKEQIEEIRTAEEVNKDNHAWVEEVDNFLAWAQEKGTNLREKPYQEKRTALTLLGVKVWIGRTRDSEQPRHKITLKIQEGITRLASQADTFSMDNM